MNIEYIVDISWIYSISFDHYVGSIFMKTRDKASKFIELAEKRVNNAKKAIKIIGNLSNKKSYDYTDSQVKQMISALNREIKDLRSRFCSEDSQGGQDFRFKK